MTILLFFNGTILTMDSTGTIVDSFAVVDDRIYACGEFTDVKTRLLNYISSQKNAEKAPDQLQKIDLKWCCVVPGFIDTHLHPIIGIYFKTQFSLAHITNFYTLRTAFIHQIEQKSPTEWTLGIDFLEERFENPVERIFPSRNELDQITTTHPIAVLRHDGHICSTNSRGLDLIGLSQATLASFHPEGGEIKLNSAGEILGIFTEGATSIVLNQIPTPDLAQFGSASRVFSDELASYGITTVGGIIQIDEKGPSGAMGAMELPLFQSMIKEQCILQDYVLYIITDNTKKLIRASKAIQQLDQGRDQFQVGGMKRFLDGTFGASTAYMFDPFSDSQNENRGGLVCDLDRLYHQFKDAYDGGFQIICHSIGDRANRILVDIYKKIRAENTFTSNKLQSSGNLLCDARIRIEHGSILTPDVIRDIRENDITVCSQPVFLENEYSWLTKRLGPSRIHHTYPYHACFEQGILLAGASDAPVESANVLHAIGISVHRYGFVLEQSISVDQALRMFTINAATALRQAHLKGSIEPGKFADFVILDRNPLEIAPLDIEKIEIYATYKRGQLIYSYPDGTKRFEVEVATINK